MTNFKKTFIFTAIFLFIATFLVVVSVGVTPREKAYDSMIKANVTQIRSLAELIYDDDPENSYLGLCADGALNENEENYGEDLKSIREDIEELYKQKYLDYEIICYSAADYYCVQAPLVIENSSFCVDSTGVAKSEGYCDSVNYDCQHGPNEGPKPIISPPSFNFGIVKNIGFVFLIVCLTYIPIIIIASLILKLLHHLIDKKPKK